MRKPRKENVGKKIKYLSCKDICCANCPLRTKLCTTFISNTKTIGGIIEKMYISNRLTREEYENAKKLSEEYFGKR